VLHKSSTSLDPITANWPMSAEQAATLKRLAEAAYELDAFKPNLTRTEVDVRIAMLTAKSNCLASRRIRYEMPRRADAQFTSGGSIFIFSPAIAANVAKLSELVRKTLKAHQKSALFITGHSPVFVLCLALYSAASHCAGV